MLQADNKAGDFINGIDYLTSVTNLEWGRTRSDSLFQTEPPKYGQS